VFIARPPVSPPRQRDLRLVRAVRRAFTGPAEFLADPANRARICEYLADMARPYAREVRAALFREPPSPGLGHSYGEMAQKLIESVTSADEPVDLLILAFSIHDLRPGQQTAAYLSHVTPGAPMAFAICDQGSAAAFSGLRIAREYASSAGIERALVIVVEQAALPYDCPVTVPSQHQGVAMLLSAPAAPEGITLRGDPGGRPHGIAPQARIADVRQHPGVPPDRVADVAAADLTELAADHPRQHRGGFLGVAPTGQHRGGFLGVAPTGQHSVALVLSDALAAAWPAPAAKQVRVTPPGQPSTGVWWGLIDELSSDAGHPDLLVAADYDPDLRYLCLTAFDTGRKAP
jgi:4-hydroxymandelate oxidase